MSIELLIWIRSVTIVMLICAHALRHVQVGKPKEPVPAQPQEQAPLKLEVTSELLAALREMLTQQHTTVIEEQPETPQIAAPKAETQPLESVLQELDRLLPDITLDDITAVVSAFNAGVQRREMIRHLHWSGKRYTTIVKPVLDAFEQLQQQPAE